MPMVTKSFLLWIAYFAAGPLLVLSGRSMFSGPKAPAPLKAPMSLHQRFAGTPLRWGAPQFLGCKGVSGFVTLRWQGEAKAPASMALRPEDLARAQAMFIAGDSQTFRFRQQVRLVPDLRGAKFEILSKNADGPTLNVRYEAEARALYCNEGKLPHEVIALLPIEPLTLFGRVPPEQFWRGESQFRKLNRHPCVNADMDPAPEAGAEFWAVWDPVRESMSEDGRKHFCRDLLKGQVTQVSIAVENANAEIKSWPTPTLDKPLTARAYFIWNPKESDDVRQTEWRRDFAGQDSRWLASLSERARKDASAPNAVVDPAIKAFAYFVDGLQEFMSIDREERTGDADHLRVLVRGRLRETARPIEMEVYLSSGEAAGAGAPVDLEILFSRETGVRPFATLAQAGAAVGVRAVFQPLGYSWTAPLKPAAQTVWSAGYRVDARTPTLMFRAWEKSLLGATPEGMIFVTWPVDMQDVVLFD